MAVEAIRYCLQASVSIIAGAVLSVRTYSVLRLADLSFFTSFGASHFLSKAFAYLKMAWSFLAAVGHACYQIVRAYQILTFDKMGLSILVSIALMPFLKETPAHLNMAYCFTAAFIHQWKTGQAQEEAGKKIEQLRKLEEEHRCLIQRLEENKAELEKDAQQSKEYVEKHVRFCVQFAELFVRLKAVYSKTELGKAISQKIIQTIKAQQDAELQTREEMSKRWEAVFKEAEELVALSEKIQATDFFIRQMQLTSQIQGEIVKLNAELQATIQHVKQTTEQLANDKQLKETVSQLQALSKNMQEVLIRLSRRE